ncbi:c-type cytochrome biogenesis protein CcmI [Phenylobacterium sp. J367]|uniref:c-type cytochrome biogenesis protein CcmI n=1 Tax=Phenylobacterium sp. J367 TaxID=2898435 RepID=UPI0021518C4F|nr:c-type cytochrome biogenesis protein CcmI [Phenylobacterium sp. J367]MCR5878867.1 c-type cytochrome biogenesis protein CcmI [Phenylobacterium sp. J367]
MIAFWAVAGVLSAAAAGLILFRAAKAASQGEAPDPTPILYRRQLAEIDDLADRGLIADAERKGARAEAARRLLAAADQPAAVWKADGASRTPVLLAATLVPALALGLYIGLGSPGLPDQPFAKRLETWRNAELATLQPAEIAAVLNRLRRERREDPELFRLLAMVEQSANNPAAAVRALRRATAIAPERADLWALLGEAYATQAGEIDEAAQAAFQEALKRDPKLIEPRFYLARQQILAGDRPGGIATWRGLLGELPADDPRAEVLRRAIAEAEDLPAEPSIQGDQMAAIRGMVDGLAARLKTDPDDPEGWVRLVRAYAVLGETAQRDAALADARARYAGRPEILNQLAQAARAEPMR